MSLESIAATFGQGGSGFSSTLRKVLVELQGLRIAVVAGAAAGTKMNVAAMRAEDTILAALVEDTTSGVTSGDDAANITVQSTSASGTITCSSVDDGDAVNVDGKTFTFRTTPDEDYEVAIGADNTASAANLVKQINSYQTRYEGTTERKAKVIATSALGVVTLNVNPENPAVSGAAGNAIVLTSTDGTDLAVTGSGTLTGGTDTGGIKSTTNLTGKSLLLFWYNKR